MVFDAVADLLSPAVHHVIGSIHHQGTYVDHTDTTRGTATHSSDTGAPPVDASHALAITAPTDHLSSLSDTTYQDIPSSTVPHVTHGSAPKFGVGWTGVDGNGNTATMSGNDGMNVQPSGGGSPYESDYTWTKA